MMRSLNARVDMLWAEAAAAHADEAADRRAEFEPLTLASALDNPLQNAIGRIPGGAVQVSAAAGEAGWRPFDPFATGRAESTGLGIAIAREIVIAHDGLLSCICHVSPACAPVGARFDMELPWHAS